MAAIEDVDCVNMSNHLVSLAGQRMDLPNKEWVLCICGHFVIHVSVNRTCLICDVPFAEAWNHHKDFFEKQAVTEKAAIDALEEEEEEEEGEDELNFPQWTSVALQNFFKNHILEAYNEKENEWREQIADNGLGNTVQDTIVPFKAFYDSKNANGKRNLLDQVRSLDDNGDKVEAFATILEEARNAL